MITRNIYDIPYPSTTPADLAGVKTFFDETLLPFLAEKMGLYFRSDLSVTSPDYAANSYVAFLAPSENADPVLSVFSVNNASASLNLKVYGIAPVKKVGSVFRPVSSNMSTNQTAGNIKRWTSFFALQSQNFDTNKSSLVVIDFNDGRKVFSFRTVTISSGAFLNVYESASIYYGNIKINGTLKPTCVVLSTGFNSSWIDDYDQCACSTEISGEPSVSKGNYTQSNGIVYSSTVGKEFLISLDFCIGEDAYIPNLAWYSNMANPANVNVGTVLNINNKKYVVVWMANSSTYSILLIPEEVN